MTIIIASEVIRDILKDEWNPGNTQNITPEIDTIIDSKLFNRPYSQVKAIIRTYEGQTVFKYNSFGYNSRNKKTPVSIEIKSMVSHKHLFQVIKEVDRIMKEKRKTARTGIDLIRIDSMKDLTDKRYKKYKAVVEIELELLAGEV